MAHSARRFRRIGTKKHILVIAVIIGVLLFLLPDYLHRNSGIDTPEPDSTVLQKPAEPGGAPAYGTIPPRPESEEDTGELAAEPLELPALSESDSVFRELADTLSNNPDLAAWLAPEQLVRRFAVAIDNIASRKVPRQQLDFAAPKGRFGAIRKDSLYTIDPQSYKRYDAVVGVITSIDVEAAGKMYLALRPLLEEAYEELGYTDRTFDDAMYAAIDMVRKARRVDGEIKLVRPAVAYKFQDPELEKLNGVHKQLLRMGPDNTLKIQQMAERLALTLFDWVEEPATKPEGGQ
ncbi:MAG: DUF3014 domain-containing protein [Pseudomonadota bacterium]